MKILFRGFIYNYHSYGIVNYFLLKHLNEHATVFIEETPFFKPTVFKEKKLNLRVYKGETVDIIFQSQFPFHYTPTSIPTVIFVTNEFDTLQKEYFNLSVNELISTPNLYFLTPSKKSYNSFINTDSRFQLKTFILPHGIDPTVFKKLTFKNEITTFLNVSAMSQNKRLPLLIETFNKIKQPAKLIIKGNADIYKIPNLNLNERITLITDSYSFEEMNELYNKADIYVSLGEHEAFDIPILEAAYLEKSVIIHANSPQNKLVPKKNQFKNELELKCKMELAISNKLKKVTISEEYLYTNISLKLKEIFSGIINK